MLQQQQKPLFEDSALEYGLSGSNQPQYKSLFDAGILE